MHTAKELAPEEDQGILFALTKAPQYANLDYTDVYGEQARQGVRELSRRPICASSINGINGPNNGIAGMILKPWDERKRSSIKLKPLVQAKLSKIEGINAFAFNLPPLPGGPGGLPVQMVINSTSGFQAVYEEMEKLKDAARKSGLFIVADSDLDFNQPVVRVKIDRSKANDLGITMAADRQHAGDAARRQLRQPLQPRGPLLSGDPAGAARRAAVAGVAGELLCADRDRPAGAAVDRGLGRDRRPIPTR